MSYGLWLWGVFLIMMVITVCLRGSFIVLGERARLPPAAYRILRYAPAAALSALVMPDILLVDDALMPFNPILLAAAVVVVVVMRSRNPWLPFILGMGTLLLLHKGLGW